MSRQFTSMNNDRPWLHAIHEKKKERSFELGKTTIDALVEEGMPVTLKNIHERSRVLDPIERGIHPNTVKTNEQLFEYYKQHSKTYKQKQRKMKLPQIKSFNDADLRKINPDRDLYLARQKYMKLSKHELVEKLIQTEQFIAINQKKRAIQMFKKFT
jgi:hypothetical protein